jgi:hypothetical protein
VACLGYNTSYLEGWDQKDHGSRTAQTKMYWDSISTNKPRGGNCLSPQPHLKWNSCVNLWLGLLFSSFVLHVYFHANIMLFFAVVVFWGFFVCGTMVWTQALHLEPLH